MTYLKLLPVLAAVAACNSPATPDVADGGAPPSIDAAPGPAELDTFIESVSGAICDALFRCCSDDLDTYFAPLRSSEFLAAFYDRLPPAVELTAGECPALMAEVLRVEPFGDWVEAARAGKVTFDSEGFHVCMSQLTNAECGEPLRNALFDGQCFGLSAPIGGRRAYFARTQGEGEACAPINDGVGSRFYGTCNSKSQFCCYVDEANPERGCTFPYDGDGVSRKGTCKSASASGQTCQFNWPLQLCSTGLECGFDDGVCFEPVYETLAIGDVCFEDFSSLGWCGEGFCDHLGSERCEVLRPNGAECVTWSECAGGECTGGVCADTTLCTD